jgi:membrane protease YdiL (CAAX protease family)
MNTSHPASPTIVVTASSSDGSSRLTAGPPIASAIHTFALFAFLIAWTYMGVVGSSRMRAQTAPNHWLMYLPTMAMEWGVFAYIAWGLRRRGSSMRELIGPRWSRTSQFFVDLGIAVVFQFCALLVLGVVAHFLNSNQDMSKVMFMMPNGPIEIVFWVLLSITAGICEETIFRGYFQRQFAGWTGSTIVGILISAVLFGSGHLYQGGKQAIVIGLLGAMLGGLAVYRRSLKPGMIGHSLQDGITGVVLSLMRH